MWKVETTKSVSVAASPVLLHSVAPTCGGHQVLHYSASNGANVRGGMIHLLWSLTGGLEWFDTSADDVGTTSALTFSASWCGDAVQLSATSSSGTWTVNLLIVSHERAN